MKFIAMIEGLSKGDLRALRARINQALSKCVPRPSMIGNTNAKGEHRMRIIKNGEVRNVSPMQPIK